MTELTPLAGSNPDHPTTRADPPTWRRSIHIRPWIDPVVDDVGLDPHSRYVETFWLGVLGPTATWLMRRLVAGFDDRPGGYDLDLAVTARSLGLSFSPNRASPFTKALQRCVMFGLAHHTGDGLAVRRRIPPISQRHLRRLPDPVQLEHDRWATHRVDVDELTRAHRVAMTLVDVGDEPHLVERRLVAIGTPDAVAAQVADNVLRLRAGDPG